MDTFTLLEAKILLRVHVETTGLIVFILPV